MPALDEQRQEAYADHTRCAREEDPHGAKPAGRRTPPAVTIETGGTVGATSRRRGGGWSERSSREGDPCRRVLLGHARSLPEAAGRPLDEGRVHRRRRPERDLP